MVLSLIADGGSTQLNRLGQNISNIGSDIKQNRLIKLANDRQDAVDAQNKQLFDLKVQGAQRESFNQTQQFNVRAASILNNTPDDQLSSSFQRLITEGREAGFDTTDLEEDFSRLSSDFSGVRSDLQGVVEAGVQLGILKGEQSNPLADAVAALTIQQREQSIQNAADKAERERVEFEQDQADRAAEVQSAAQQKDLATAEATDILNLARDLANDSDGISAVSGVSGRLPTVNPSTTTFEAKLAKLVNRLSLENTDKLKGAISEGELRLLADSISSVVSGGTVEGNTRELQGIVNKIERELGVDITDFGARNETPQRRSTDRRGRASTNIQSLVDQYAD